MLSDFRVNPPAAVAVKSLLEFGERGRIRVTLLMRLGEHYATKCFALNSTRNS